MTDTEGEDATSDGMVSFSFYGLGGVREKMSVVDASFVLRLSRTRPD